MSEGFFGSDAPDVTPTPPPPEEDADEQVAQRQETKQLSLARYLTTLGQLGANELRGNQGETGLRR